MLVGAREDGFDAPVARVQVSDDGGRAWAEAEVAPGTRRTWAWQAWQCDWTAAPGRTPPSRATDAEGHTQPLEQSWNRGGFANNLVQHVTVLCC